MRWLRYGLAAAAVAAVFLVALAAYLLHLRGEASTALRDVAQRGEDLTSAISSGQRDQVTAATDELTDAVTTAQDVSDSLGWVAMKLIPRSSPDAKYYDALTTQLAEIAPAIEVAATAFGELPGLWPQDGALDSAAIDKVVADATAAEEQLSQIDDRIAAIDAPARGPYANAGAAVEQGVARATRAISDLVATSTALSALADSETAQRILLITQNNAIPRALGGYPGAVSVLRVEEGQLDIVRHEAGGALNAVQPRGEPPLAKDLRDIFDPGIGGVFTQMNRLPDPTSVLDRWRAVAENYFNLTLDGVLVIDNVVLANLVEPDSLSNELGNEYALAVASNTVEDIDTPPPPGLITDVNAAPARSAYSDLVFSTLTEVLAGTDTASLSTVGKALASDRLWWRPAPTSPEGLQSETTDFMADPASVGVVLGSENGPNALTPLSGEVSLRNTFCSGGQQGLRGALTLQVPNALTDEVFPAGEEQNGAKPRKRTVTLRLYAPADGALTNLVVNGKTVAATPVTHRGREMVTATAKVGARNRVQAQWQVRPAAGNLEEVTVEVTPGLSGLRVANPGPPQCPAK